MNEIQLPFTSLFEELLHEILLSMYESQVRLYFRNLFWSLTSMWDTNKLK